MHVACVERERVHVHVHVKVHVACACACACMCVCERRGMFACVGEACACRSACACVERESVHIHNSRRCRCGPNASTSSALGPTCQRPLGISRRESRNRETRRAALKRELCEELGITVRGTPMGTPRFILSHRGPRFTVHVLTSAKSVSTWECRSVEKVSQYTRPY